MAEAKKSLIDQRLLGSWEQIKKENETGNELKSSFEVIRFNENELIFKTNNGRNNNIIRAFTVYVKGTPLLNMQNIDEDREYIYGRYTVTGDGVLTLEFVANDLFEGRKIKSSKELYKFIKKNFKNKKLFDPELTFCFKKNNQ